MRPRMMCRLSSSEFCCKRLCKTARATRALRSSSWKPSCEPRLRIAPLSSFVVPSGRASSLSTSMNITLGLLPVFTLGIHILRNFRSQHIANNFEETVPADLLVVHGIQIGTGLGLTDFALGHGLFSRGHVAQLAEAQG